MVGYIKLYRQLFESPFYFANRFDEIRAWIDLLLLANYEEGEIRVRGVRIRVGRGQIAMSLDALAVRWQWSKHTVINYLKNLESALQIALQRNNVISLITIVNYEKYQGIDEENLTSIAPQNALQNALQSKEKVSPFNNLNPPLKESSIACDKEGKEDKKETTINIVDKKRAYIDKRPQKAEELKVRRQWLIDSIRDVGAKFPKEMCNEFYLYWSELTPDGKVMRFELQQTWETVRRLATWYGKNKERWIK